MTEINQEVAEPADIPEVSFPGQRLRETREAGRMSREEVAHHLHLDVQIISALEEDNYGRLPSPIYICGYLRAYARLLKLPESEIVGAYTKGKEINASLIPENINILPGKKPIKPGLFKLIILIVLAVVITAGVIWVAEEAELSNRSASNGNKERLITDFPLQQNTDTLSIEPNVTLTDSEQQYQESTSAIESELMPPSAQEIEQKIAAHEAASPEQAPVAEVPANKLQGDLRLVFNEDSWAEVTDENGVRHVYRLVKAGSEIYVDGQAPFRILLGKASGVDIFYKDEQFDHKRFHRDEIAYFRIGVAE